MYIYIYKSVGGGGGGGKGEGIWVAEPNEFLAPTIDTINSFIFERMGS
jgi:hypothetical protein